MIAVLAVVAGVLSVVLLVPALVFFAECALARAPRPPRPTQTPRPRTVVLVPAHDEALGIAPTVEHLLREIASGDRLLVIADNCTDETAALARVAGAEVIERQDPSRRGKGYAISYAVAALRSDPPDVVIIVDADCRVSPGSLEALAREAHGTGHPCQADYLIFAPSAGGPIASISALAVLVKNRVRPLGLHRLGFPCHLTGSGMAFPFPVLRDAPSMEGHIVEDLALGIELAIRGRAPWLVPYARVTSELPAGSEAALKQRRRWEHGHLSTLLSDVPRLLGAGISQGRPSLVALGLDLAVPPLALLVGLLGLATLLSLALVGVGGSAFALELDLLALACVTVGVLVGWARFGRDRVPLRTLLAVPFYVLWKIPLYVAFLVKRQASWERTQRTERRDSAAESVETR